MADEDSCDFGYPSHAANEVPRLSLWQSGSILVHTLSYMQTLSVVTLTALPGNLVTDCRCCAAK